MSPLTLILSPKGRGEEERILSPPRGEEKKRGFFLSQGERRRREDSFFPKGRGEER